MLGKQQEGQHVCIRVRKSQREVRGGRARGVARQVTKGLVSHYKVSPFYKLALRPQGSQPLATPLDLLGPLVGRNIRAGIPAQPVLPNGGHGAVSGMAAMCLGTELGSLDPGMQCGPHTGCVPRASPAQSHPSAGIILPLAQPISPLLGTKEVGRKALAASWVVDSFFPSNAITAN